MRRALVVILGLALFAAVPAAAKKRVKPEPGGDEVAQPTLAKLTEGATRHAGLFDLYRKDGKLYLHLPEELLDVPLGFAAVHANALGDFAMRGGALDTQLVRFRRTGEHLQLIKENLDFRADPDSPMVAVLERSFLDSPAFAGKLEKLDDEPAPLVIDGTGLFGPQLAEVMPKRSGFSVSADEGVLDSVKAFEDNVVVRVRYPLRRAEGGPPQQQDGFGRFLRPGRIPDRRVAEAIVDYNFYRLPDDGFEPRFEDERIGGFVNAYKDYTEIDGKDTLFRHLLSRWDVREPITFYLDHSVPERWRQPIREASEWWNPAFAKVGVTPGVQILDPPDEPGWDPADIRHSVIYWNIADDLVFSGAAGPTLTDPRNGKVLKANVYLNGEFFSFALSRYLVYSWWRAPEPGSGANVWRERQAAQRALRRGASVCSRAASFSSQIAFARLVLQARGVLAPGTPEADRFAREAFDELVVHELGHALGFPHNWKASLVSSWEDVRDNKVSGRAANNIFSSSVMDYNPIYLAPKGQPQGDYFMRELGPYDELSVEYLYRPLSGTPEEQAAELDRIAARAETEPGLIFDSGELGFADPTTNSDDFGNDPLAFAESRLRVLHEEVLPRLPELVLGEGHDYNLLRQALDSAIFSVALDYIDITARHVGGQTLLRRVATSSAAAAAGGPPIAPLDAETQRRALAVLDRWVFAHDVFDLSPELLAQLKADLKFDWNYPWRYASDYNVGHRIAGLYEAALSTVLEPARLARVLDNERRLDDGADRFTLPELFDTLTGAIFDGDPLNADRRALQRIYVNKLAALTLRPERGTPAEASQLAAVSLESIADSLAASAGGERYATAHRRALALQIDRTLSAGIELPAE